MGNFVLIRYYKNLMVKKNYNINSLEKRNPANMYVWCETNRKNTYPTTIGLSKLWKEYIILKQGLFSQAFIQWP